MPFYYYFGVDFDWYTLERGRKSSEVFIWFPEIKEISKPKGGFTDVGLHTGGKERFTTWPLVKSFFIFFLLEIIPDSLKEYQIRYLFALFYLSES